MSKLTTGEARALEILEGLLLRRGPRVYGRPEGVQDRTLYNLRRRGFVIVRSPISGTTARITWRGREALRAHRTNEGG